MRIITLRHIGHECLFTRNIASFYIEKLITPTEYRRYFNTIISKLTCEEDDAVVEAPTFRSPP